MPCTKEVPNLRTQHKACSDQMCLFNKCTVMGDLKGAPAVQLIFPLQVFLSLYLIVISGIAAAGKPIYSE